MELNAGLVKIVQRSTIDRNYKKKMKMKKELNETIYEYIGLDMNGTHKVLAYADDVNLIGEDIRTIERNSDVLLNACKDIGLSVNIDKTKYTEMGRHRGDSK